MKLARVATSLGLLAALSSPAAARTVAQADLDQNGFKLYGLPLTPDRSSGAATLRFVTPGAGYLFSSAQDGTITASATIPYADIAGAPPAITSVTGDATAVGPGAAVLTLSTNVVSNGKFRQGGPLTVVGVAGNATANVADIAASGGLQFLGTNSGGTALAWSTLSPASLSGLYSSSLPSGPTGLGTVGAATTMLRSDATHPTYRSDTIATAWFVDPASGSDSASNNCTTAATACATLQEIKRRWWGGEITSNTTVTILDNVPNTDVGTWNVIVKPGVTVIFQGVLGATTGFGGRAIDNTLYSGTVTSFTAASAVPAADDIELGDTGIPTSFTASGLLANGVIFRRETGAGTADRWWFAAKDLGSKTLRCSPIMNSTNSLSMNAALAVSDTYKAYTLKTLPSQNFISAGALSGAGTIIYRFVRDNKAQNPIVSLGFMIRRDRSWVDHLGIEMMVTTANVAFDATGGLQLAFPFQTPPQWSGGMVRGAGTDTVSIFGQMGIGAPIVFQGAVLKLFDGGYCTQEQTIAFHDTSTSAIQVQGLARWIVNSLTVGTLGISGKGNSGKLLTIANEGQFVYGTFSSSPPFVAGSSSDASPIQIGASTYAVSAMPATTGVAVASETKFPSTVFETAGPARLTWAGVADGTWAKRSGSTLVGSAIVVGDVSGAVATTRTLTAGAGLVGLGTLAADRTVDVAAGDATIVVHVDDIVAGVMQTANIAPAAITNAKQANMTAPAFKGRVTTGSGPPEDLTSAQATAMLNPFTSTLQGLVPASGGGSTNVLHADGTWSSPGGGTVTAITATDPATSTPSGTTYDIGVKFDNVTVILSPGGGLRRAAIGGDGTIALGSNTFALTNIPTATPMAGSLLATAIAAPSTPVSGKAFIYVDPISKNLVVKNDAGTVNHGVQTAAAVSHQFVTAINDAGSVSLAQPNYTDLSGSVPAITALTGDATATGPGSAALTLATVNATVGTFPYASVTVNGKGLVTGASAGATPAPVGATYITQTPNATLTNEQALTSLAASGVMQANNASGVVSTFAVGANRIPTGSGSNGALTDVDNLKLNGQPFGFGSLQEVQVYNASTSATAFAGYRVGTDSSFINGFNFGMTGTNWSGGALGTNVGLIELAAGASPIIMSNNGTGKISFTTTNSRVERLSIATGGAITVGSLSAGGIVKSTAGVLGIATATIDYESPLTFTNGVRRVLNNVTNDLSTGVAGGQAVVGGTAAGNSLTYSSNPTGTKGSHIWGTTSGMVYNEATKVWTIGTASPDTDAAAQVAVNSTTFKTFMISNSSSSTTAQAGFAIGQNDAGTGSLGLDMLTGSNYAPSGEFGPGTRYLHLTGGSGNMVYRIFQAAGDHVFMTTTSDTVRMRIANNGNVTIPVLAGGGMVKASPGSGTLAIATANADYQPPVTWPSPGRFIVAPGTFGGAAQVGGNPTAGNRLQYDFVNDFVATEDDASFAAYSTGGTADANAAFVHLNGSHLASERRGTTPAADFTVSAGTAALHLGGGNVYVDPLTTNGYVKTGGGSGHLDVVTHAPGAAYKWSVYAANSGAGFRESYRDILLPADTGMLFVAAADFVITTGPGGSVGANLAAKVGTSTTGGYHAAASSWTACDWTLEIPFFAATGSGSATLRVSLFKTSNPSSSGTYAEIGSFVTTTGATGASSAAGSGTCLVGVAAGDKFFVALYRTDSNSSLTVTPVDLRYNVEFYK